MLDLKLQGCNEGRIMANQPIFQPPWWLRNKHIQSIYASVFRPQSTVDLRWEEFTLPDGDFVDLAWAGPAPINSPTLLLFHGMEGSVFSPYIQEMLDLFVRNDWRVVIMHFRSCSGRMNRNSCLYNAEYTGDIKAVVDSIAQRYPDMPLFTMGFSLGGHLLMRYLAQYNDAPVNAAIAVSMPFEIGKSSDYLIPFYQKVLLKSLKAKVEAKITEGHALPVTVKELANIQTLRKFDALITKEMYGYNCVNEYYDMASNRWILKDVQHPSLILHAMDDPFVPPNSVPEAFELSDSIELDISQHGGHMGFIKGGLPWKPSYWFAQRVSSFFEQHMASQSLSPWDMADDEGEWLSWSA
jgi:predicted alpha/beta-fold hydrolase